MAVQGVAPSLWGPLSDTHGRRITFISTFAVYLVATICLVFSKSLAGLMVFRALQAAGSAATISVGAGVIGDITTAKERGGFMGSFGGIRMLGQSIGPVIGGIVSEYFGYHAIFWFLFILGSVALLVVLLFLPETLHRIAGNGTVPLSGVNRPFIHHSLSRHYWQKTPSYSKDRDEEIARTAPKISMSSILAPLRFLCEKDVFATLAFGAVVYAIWSMMTASTTALFQPRFHLSNLQVGLIFLPNGAACVVGSCLTGSLLDRDYRVVENQYRTARGLPADVLLDHNKLADFPVSRARLRSSWYFAILFVLAAGGYGFAMASPKFDSKQGMALPLVLQFIIAFTATAIFTQNSALMVDLYPGAGAGATAVNNLIRCSIGALGVAVVQLIIDALGAGLTFLVLAAISAAMSPLLWLQWAHGEEWREARMKRLASREAENTAA
ncbi:major facilitator superfamily domain-containing protein [Lasiosphaeria ovina]|uniref:Major facilitator superfamily domain-containing protein n=1 Tax=Lasiosphaeria ovina TaxID=92902 RepID=A0AAE0NID6_9PEZI|nr:major facilitator superfamily domain-containing protein [Lasiosphaeria ovina]